MEHGSQGLFFYGCFLVIEAHGGTRFRTPCPNCRAKPFKVLALPRPRKGEIFIFPHVVPPPFFSVFFFAFNFDGQNNRTTVISKVDSSLCEFRPAIECHWRRTGAFVLRSQAPGKPQVNPCSSCHHRTSGDLGDVVVVEESGRSRALATRASRRAENKRPCPHEVALCRLCPAPVLKAGFELLTAWTGSGSNNCLRGSNGFGERGVY